MSLSTSSSWVSSKDHSGRREARWLRSPRGQAFSTGATALRPSARPSKLAQRKPHLTQDLLSTASWNEYSGGSAPLATCGDEKRNLMLGVIFQHSQLLAAESRHPHFYLVLSLHEVPPAQGISSCWECIWRWN